jgi:phosphoglycerol transferase
MKKIILMSLVFISLLSPLACSNKYAVNIDMTSKNISEAVFRNFSFAEPHGRWTDGSPAEIKLNKALPKNCKIELHVETTFASNVGQTISVDVGNIVQTFKSPQAKSVIDLYYKGIPENTYLVSINIPNPGSPKDLKLSTDDRKLGIALSKLVITETK